ncbi:TIGR03915 family putative DNA repair protein [uncultured Gemmiger sp.]|uniref:TIGR03915 family putative DNA repair protein n=1 Tax=uncultured Gemmiger sp. TaxID=1623490 RepID=UPI0025EC26F9|nr:TIGR03915 family putative DNA repair protein [uncultured Gemmiger sp.]
MHYRADVKDLVYRYDGSFAGFLCCVFESFAHKEVPLAIAAPGQAQLSLYPEREIVTVETNARRVFAGIGRLGGAVRYRLAIAFLSGEEEKDMDLLRFIRRAFEIGPNAAAMLGDAAVCRAWELERTVQNEAHLMIEFLRFEQRGNMLGAVIHPKNRVLPLLRAHFCSRLPDESFLICDATHHTAMLRRGDVVQYLPMDQYDPEPDAAEEQWQRMWRRFFQALTIEERRNETCQRTHCPKRFWQDMCEMPLYQKAGRNREKQ